MTLSFQDFNRIHAKLMISKTLFTWQTVSPKTNVSNNHHHYFTICFHFTCRTNEHTQNCHTFGPIKRHENFICQTECFKAKNKTWHGFYIYEKQVEPEEGAYFNRIICLKYFRVQPCFK